MLREGVSKQTENVNKTFTSARALEKNAMFIK